MVFVDAVCLLDLENESVRDLLRDMQGQMKEMKDLITFVALFSHLNALPLWSTTGHCGRSHAPSRDPATRVACCPSAIVLMFR